MQLALGCTRMGNGLVQFKIAGCLTARVGWRLLAVVSAVGIFPGCACAGRLIRERSGDTHGCQRPAFAFLLLHLLAADLGIVGIEQLLGAFVKGEVNIGADTCTDAARPENGVEQFLYPLRINLFQFVGVFKLLTGCIHARGFAPV